MADGRRICLELVAADEPWVTLENVVGVPSDCVLELSDVVETAVGRASGGVRGATKETAGWAGDGSASGESTEPGGRSRDVLRRTCTELRVGGEEGGVRVCPTKIILSKRREFWETSSYLASWTMSWGYRYP